MEDRYLIEGPAGSIECHSVSLRDRDLWVLCDPHPLYGGNMEVAVLHAVSSSLQKVGTSNVKFNF